MFRSSDQPGFFSKLFRFSHLSTPNRSKSSRSNIIESIDNLSNKVLVSNDPCWPRWIGLYKNIKTDFHLFAKCNRFLLEKRSSRNLLQKTWPCRNQNILFNFLSSLIFSKDVMLFERAQKAFDGFQTYMYSEKLTSVEFHLYKKTTYYDS